MDIRATAKVLSLISIVVSAGMLPPLVLSVVDGTYDALPFSLSILSGLALSGVLWVFSGEREIHAGIREGIGITGFSWIIASFIGAMPYWVSGLADYTDAFFETMSGFTTTGATIFTNIESLPRGILLWRSITHWVGGMGIIVLSLAVMPFLGVSGMDMYKAEVPGITAGKVTPRLHQTAVKLWTLYIIFTFTEAVMLMFGGMNMFDAICHSFSTIATGGFSTKNNSIAYFTSPYIQWVIIVFMFLSGVNFSLYFAPKTILDDAEFRGYAFLAVISSVAIAICLYVNGVFEGIEYTLRQSFFHVVTVMTTTGFIVEDYDLWPEFTKFIIVILMFVGASGGSTGGGCKVSRFMILGCCLRAEVKKLLHPNAIVRPRFNGKPLGEDTLNSSEGFFVLYMLILAVATLFITAYDIDILTSFTAVLTCLSNVGPGLSRLGATEDFAFLPESVKWLLSFCMLAGRLELFAVFLLLLPGTYKK